jgi:uncharacterized protein YndB with AHSA1/START domain
MRRLVAKLLCDERQNIGVLMKFLLATALLILATSLAVAGSGDRAIVRSVVVSASVGDVWRAWTTTEGLASFFAPNAHVELKLGGRFELLFDAKAPIGHQGSEGCQILSFVPERMLSFTWNAPPAFPAIRHARTFVVLQFETLPDGGTRIDLRHAGWKEGKDWDAVFAYFDRVWPAVLASCRARLEADPVKADANASPPPSVGLSPEEILGRPAMRRLEVLLGGVWEGEVAGPSGPMRVEFRYRRHKDGVGIVGEGVIGKGTDGAIVVRNQFGWDPLAKAVYYLDSHNSGTVYWGHAEVDGEDLVLSFGPVGGDPGAFGARDRFPDPDTLQAIIRNAEGEEQVGFTLRRRTD